VTGAGWLERGGIYVSACIRGGGEFGPNWHKSAQRENKLVRASNFLVLLSLLIARLFSWFITGSRVIKISLRLLSIWCPLGKRALTFILILLLVINTFSNVSMRLMIRVTSPRYLGIRGGSNGGLLTANVMLMRPDLFRAVTSAVPLTDMKRYHKLLAGHSWMEEYGDPEKPEVSS
jgi:prolyl oligopeptidase